MEDGFEAPSKQTTLTQLNRSHRLVPPSATKGKGKSTSLAQEVSRPYNVIDFDSDKFHSFLHKSSSGKKRVSPLEMESDYDNFKNPLDTEKLVISSDQEEEEDQEGNIQFR